MTESFAIGYDVLYPNEIFGDCYSCVLKNSKHVNYFSALLEMLLQCCKLLFTIICWIILSILFYNVFVKYYILILFDLDHTFTLCI